MKVILLKDVAKLGRKYEVKNVSDGHALNLLIPQGSAIQATPDAVKRTEIERKKTEGERKLHADLLVMNIKDLEGKTITITGKANEKGHLFAGLHTDVIVSELQKQCEVQVDPSFIKLDQPLKTVGDHQVEASGGGKTVKFTVKIEGERV